MAAVAEVRMWGRTIGAVAQVQDTTHAAFQYDPAFTTSGIEVAPLTMPLSNRVYAFPALSQETFHGLPGLLADSLPDRFGNALIDAWLAAQGRPPGSLSAVERLCYTGARGMGALEYVPALGPQPGDSAEVEVDALVELASRVLTQRERFQTNLADPAQAAALNDILRVGTSAGGARAKAVIAWNATTGEVRSGQVDTGAGFEYWLLKLDGVSGDTDRELTTPQGYGALEFAYANMALAAGLHMAPCRLLEEGGRRHFMTRRFDRLDDGGKLHMQTLGGLAHYNYNEAGAYSYEQALLTMRQLHLPMDTIEEQFRRMAFNVIARNQDDHVKNIAFLMDKQGRWSLSPAYDLTFSFNPRGAWTARHQMSLNGKRDDFTIDDFRACARSASMKRGRAETIVNEVSAAVDRWPSYAADAGIPRAWRERVQRHLRLNIGKHR